MVAESQAVQTIELVSIRNPGSSSWACQSERGERSGIGTFVFPVAGVALDPDPFGFVLFDLSIVQLPLVAQIANDR